MSQYYSSSRYCSQPRKPKNKLRKNIGTKVICVGFVALTIVGSLLYFWPVPKIEAQPAIVNYQTEQPATINWPNAKQSAIGIAGYGVMKESDNQQPLPTASMAKIFTALMVVKAKPLKVGEEGPKIEINTADVNLMNEYINKLGSYFPVHNGQVLTEEEALKALLIVSANNIADKLAIWAYGSSEAYVQQANEYFKEQGLTGTHISDASGFSPQTVSTASDMVLATQMLMNDPVLSSIVSMKDTVISGTTVHNTNGLLGSDGVVGVKTGNTDEAKGCFVIARNVKLAEDKEVTLLAVVMGANTVPEAMLSAKQLTVQAQSSIKYRNILPKGTIVTKYQTPWGESVDVVTSQDVEMVAWPGAEIKPKLKIRSLSANETGMKEIGVLYTAIGNQKHETPVQLSKELNNPPVGWRLAGRYTSRVFGSS